MTPRTTQQACLDLECDDYSLADALNEKLGTYYPAPLKDQLAEQAAEAFCQARMAKVGRK